MPLPLLPLISAGAGLVQSIVGGIKAGKAQKQLEKMQSPQYAQNQGILQYYNQALLLDVVMPLPSRKISCKKGINIPIEIIEKMMLNKTKRKYKNILLLYAFRY